VFFFLKTDSPDCNKDSGVQEINRENVPTETSRGS